VCVRAWPCRARHAANATSWHGRGDGAMTTRRWRQRSRVAARPPAAWKGKGPTLGPRARVHAAPARRSHGGALAAGAATVASLGAKASKARQNGRHPRRQQDTPMERIGEGPAKASKGVALVAWPWLCVRARASGSPEPRHGRARHGGARRGKGRRRLWFMMARLIVSCRVHTQRATAS